ncbi:hypothetical protein [Klebsiella quasipneumoniae]|uniref:hypothetical protein n=1 Tax=Klebsiella quasipneumoniae TaxID=1463165 RepID=UPI0027FC0F6B|nr:hypothetical protein [Klebsiella quasipneumoniae]MEB4700658.1 hypothetical protein [Klebsiella quasipneumoniae]HBM3155533.1 hypothetical protein [Klebsiella michiganensis]HDT6051434.1 hypothetical protein [Klebsiella michiganensis]HDT6068406.1 hypothetical protein [Klebsiella michiganensis]
MVELYNYNFMLNANELYLKASYNPQQYGFLYQNGSADKIEFIHVISGGLSSVAQAINNSGSSTLSDGVILALTGALSAFAFNLIQKLLDARSVRLTKSGDAMLLLIKEFEEITVRYWVRGHDSSKNDAESNIYDQINIKAMLMTLDKNVNLMLENLPFKNKSHNIQKLSAFSSDVYDLASGDDFESAIRPPNKGKAFAISKKCSEAKAIILGLI